MSQTTETTECCAVCTETFTNHTRKNITCLYCSYKACKSCVTRYLLTQVSEPHCMNCKTGWNYEFLYNNLTKTLVSSLIIAHSSNFDSIIQIGRAHV